MKEISVPSGYVKTNDIIFVIEVKGELTLNGDSVANNELSMVDDYVTHEVSLSKVDVTGNELPGEKLNITGDYNTDIAWESTATPQKFNLKPGKYTMREITAPRSVDSSIF